MPIVQRCTAMSIALLSVACFMVGCSTDRTTAPVAAGASASKSTSGGGGGGSGGGGTSGGSGSGGGGTVTPPSVPAPPSAEPPGVFEPPVYLRESFGFDPLGDHTGIRWNAAGISQQINIGSALAGIRAEFPNNSAEVWMSPNVHDQPTWAFAQSSVDPDEPFSTLELPGVENGVVVSDVKPATESNNDALLPFPQSVGAATASITAYAGPSYTIAIGFTTSGALTNNFETAGAAWLVVKMPQQDFFTSPATWELHTGGLSGQSISGTFVASNFNKIAVSYDPASGTVAGSVLGVPTPALHYAASGVSYVGFQGHGIVNDFHVVAGSVTPKS